MEIIVIVSFLPLAAWFCYACRLILLTGGNGRNVEGFNVSAANEAGTLEREYRLISYLVQNGSEFRPDGEGSLEYWMIRVYYRAVRTFYNVCRIGPKRFSEALLEEMSSIVRYMSESMGQQSQVAAN